MGWIKNEIGKPFGDKLLRLWKHDELDVFIMDNHLAALFCWLGSLARDDHYRLFHIDHHWDMTDMPEEDIDVLIQHDFDDLSRLDEFTGLRTTGAGGKFPLVDFTNYMSPLPYLRKRLFNAVLGADQDMYDAAIATDPRFLKVSVSEFFDTVRTLFEIPFAGRTLLNIDIDFLFRGMGSDARRVYGDDPINLLISLMHNLNMAEDIVTIALSPEFCGTGQAEAICARICDELSITHPF